jgi:hypothetical protein
VINADLITKLSDARMAVVVAAGYDDSWLILF